MVMRKPGEGVRAGRCPARWGPLLVALAAGAAAWGAAASAGCYSKTVKAKGLGAREAHPVVSEPDAPGKKSPFGFTEDF